MAATNINRVVMTGNLTRDPELHTRRKGASGEWEDKPNYFDVTVWGAQGENCARYLAKGRPVAIDGRLEWREYERDGQKRQAIDIIADSVQFLGGRDDAGAGNGFSGAPVAATGGGDVPIDNRDFQSAPAAPASTADDDIPF
jgi:single-strand DNA-binding protein